MSYAVFEGRVPEDDYGVGTVTQWDRSTWSLVEGKSVKDLENGHAHVRIAPLDIRGQHTIFPAALPRH